MSEQTGAARGHALLYMAPTIVQSALPIVTLPIFTRILSREEYGLWGLATASGVVLAGMCSLGLQTGFERNYFATPVAETRGRLLYSVALTTVALQTVALAIALAAGPAIAERLMGSSRHWPMIALGTGIPALAAVKTFFLATLRNEGRAREYVRFSVDELFLGTLLSLGAVLWLGWGAAGLLAGPLIASAAVLTALIASFLRRIPFGVDRSQLADTVRVSLPLAPRALLSAAGTQLDRLVLGAIGSLADVGVYTIGQRMAQLVFAFMTALQNVYQPAVYRMLFAGDMPRRIGEFLFPFAFASAAVALGAILFAQEIVQLTTAPEFAFAAPILAVLALHYGLMFFGKQPQLIFARRADLVLAVSALGIVLNAAGVYFGAQAGGPLGAAFGVLMGGAVSGGVALYLATRLAPIGYPVRPMLLVFGSLPIALLVSLASYFCSVPPLAAFGVRLALFALFVLIGWRAGLLAAVWRGRGDPAATPAPAAPADDA